MIEYINPNKYPVNLVGPDRAMKVVSPNEIVVLPEFFKRYVPRYLRVLREDATIKPTAQIKTQPIRINPMLKITPVIKVVRTTIQPRHQLQRKIVGKVGMVSNEATKYYQKLISSNLLYPISNDIGVGILSYNRLGSLKRLVESISKHTNLFMTTVFVADDCSTDLAIKQYLSTLNNFVIIPTKERLGIAGNTNRLLKCLSRFRYKIILNDDVEILQPGWEYLYRDAIQKTGFHHFCYRQSGLLGASRVEGRIANTKGISVQTITERPHGAVLAFDDTAFDAVGYFDECFGIYGMEHVDWSWRVSKSGIQQEGYHDVVGAEHFYTIHHETSVVEHRADLLVKTRELMQKLHQDKSRCYVKNSEKSEVKGISCIVPCRASTGREDAIRTVILNLKAQKFPYIEIVMVEQDDSTKIAHLAFKPLKYFLATSSTPFIKALAFNIGFKNITQDKVILHDADMLVQNDYTTIMDTLLDNHEGVHLGKNVLYLTREATAKLASTGILAPDLQIERTVGYFEGGSLGCTRKAYFDAGGFNEDFVGYGCEDTNFFQRLSSLPTFYNQRTLDFIHLWHDRNPGWMEHHRKNKAIYASCALRPMVLQCSDLRNRLISKYGLK